MLDDKNRPKRVDELKKNDIASKKEARNRIITGTVIMAILISLILIVSCLAPVVPIKTQEAVNDSAAGKLFLNGLRGFDSSDGSQVASPANGLNFQEALGFFVENKGQLDDGVCFVARTGFGKALFYDSMVQYLLERNEQGKVIDYEVITLTFPGSNAVHPQGRTILSHYTNYLIGNPSSWVTGARDYGSVIYVGLWSGINLNFRFSDMGLKYEFIVEPYVSEQVITVKVQGAEVTADASSLRFDTGYGYLMDDGLCAIQQPSNLHLFARYVADNGIFTFSIEGRDKSQELIIDPLIYSTCFGGSGDDNVQDIALDDAGDIYVIGYTSSPNLPISGPYQDHHGGGTYDAFVLKIGANNNVPFFMTYIGGSGEDYGQGIAVDDDGNAFIGGYTNSSDFPALRPPGAGIGGANDVFVCELISNGTALKFSTLIGGSGDDQGRDLAIDSNGNIFLTGITNGDFPLYNPLQGTYGGGEYDAFAVKLNPTGDTFVYSTYIGGEGRDEGLGITLCLCKNPYIVGSTDSTNFPTTAGSLQPSYAGGTDAFILWFNGAGNGFTYSTYVGGQGNETAKGIAVDGDDFAYVTGWTSSTDFPIVEPFQATYGGGPTDAFELKLNPAGTALFHSTYIGGSGEEFGRGIALDANRNAYVTGDTNSADFPLLNPSQSTFGGRCDAFNVKLDMWSGLANSTYVGGSEDDGGQAIAVDDLGNTYVVGTTASLDLPTSALLKGSSRGGIDSFIATFGPATVPSPPTDLGASVGISNITLNWSPPAMDGGSLITNYSVYRGMVSGREVWLATINNTLTYTNEDLINGQTYYYKISAVNSIGESSLSEEVHLTAFGVPTAPLNLQAEAGDSMIELNWTAPSYSGPGVLTYHLFRDGIQIWQGSETSYLDEGVTNGREYTYKIAVNNSIGRGPDSIPVSATPMSQSIPPGVPRELVAKAGDGQITLTWEAPIDSGSSAVTSYKIYRGTTSGNESILVTVWNALSYTDAGLTNGQTYYYKVTAVSSAGESQVVEEVTATPTSSNQGFETELILIIVAVIAAGIMAGMYLMRKKR